jgi:flagellar biosynthesis protein FliR
MNAAGLFEPIIKIVMILFRVAGFWMFFPWVLSLSIPPIIRVSSALALSLALLPVVGNSLPTWTMAQAPTLAQIVAFGTKEVIIGVALALVGRWFFAAILGASQWVGMQVGFSAAALMNPDFESGDTSWAQFHGWIGLMLYFAVGGHFMTLSALIDSYQFDFSNILERVSSQEAGFQFWTTIGQSFFVWMLKLSGPIVVVTLILQAALGVLSKFIPQINIWTVSIPITLAVGILLSSVIIANYSEVLSGLFKDARGGQDLLLRYLGTR